jgi:hypothetical protein
VKYGVFLIWCFFVFFCSPAFGEEPGLQDSPQEEAASSLELLEEYVVGRNIPIENKYMAGSIGLILGGAAVMGGSLALALLTPIYQWDTGGTYGAIGALSGWLLGSYGDMMFAFGLTELIIPPIDFRREYGSVLDETDPDAREARAGKLLERMAKRERSWNIATSLTSIVGYTLPLAGFLITRAHLANDPDVTSAGAGYMLGLAFVPAVWLITLIAILLST